MTDLRIILAIDSRPKGIPYGPVTYADSQNHGFKVLKGKPDEVETIPEAKDNSHIQAILKYLNALESPFFSVGCEKSFNKDADGYWAKGYIEFAFNYRELVEDATHYFRLFFHFNKWAEHFVSEHELQFLWELQPAHFSQAGVDGFSCCVWITTGNSASPDETRRDWESAVSLLNEFIKEIKRPISATQIYSDSPNNSPKTDAPDESLA